jgi:uncharacterized membrane protein
MKALVGGGSQRSAPMGSTVSPSSAHSPAHSARRSRPAGRRRDPATGRRRAWGDRGGDVGMKLIPRSIQESNMNRRNNKWHPQRYLVTGMITIIPLWITWWVLAFIFDQLSAVSMPAVRTLAGRLNGPSDPLIGLLLLPGAQSLVAALLTLLSLYLLGLLTSFVVGRRLIALMDGVLHRIPLVQTIYGGVRQLLRSLESRPDQPQRVVLIEFPGPHMRAVGFVTKILKDADSGRELATVYVPTTPNPTSGYVQIVPTDRLTVTDWTVDEAMRFIISGGTISPDSIRYGAPTSTFTSPTP